MKSFWKKVLLSFALAGTFLTSFSVPFVSAQTWYDQSFSEWHTKVYDQDISPPSEIFGERYTAAQVQWVIYGLGSFIIGITGTRDVVNCILTKTLDNCVDAINLLPANNGFEPGNGGGGGGSGFGQTTQNSNLLSQIFSTRSLSGVGYVREKLANFGLIEHASAQQGFGFGELAVIQDMWSASRDTMYAVAVILTIVMAFMVMFRMKISPQVVITIQSALPKIIITLVLITFSYAIAGFMVDLVYVLTGVIAMFIGQIDVWGPFDAFRFMIGELNIIGGGIFLYFLFYLILFPLALLAALLSAPNPFVAGLLTPIFVLVVIIATIILLIMLLFNWLKALYMLLKTTALIYLSVIFAPFQIGMGILSPQGGFGPWLKNLVSNLLVFPVTGTMIALSYIFLSLSIQTAFNSVLAQIQDFVSWINSTLGFNFFTGNPIATGWVPPLLGLGDGVASLIFLMISFVMITLVPKVAEMIKSAIAGQSYGYGTAIGQAFGPANTVGLGATQYASSAQQAAYSKAKYPTRGEQTLQNIFQTVRSVSGGKIK